MSDGKRFSIPRTLSVRRVLPRLSRITNGQLDFFTPKYFHLFRAPFALANCSITWTSRFLLRMQIGAGRLLSIISIWEERHSLGMSSLRSTPSVFLMKVAAYAYSFSHRFWRDFLWNLKDLILGSGCSMAIFLFKVVVSILCGRAVQFVSSHHL